MRRLIAAIPVMTPINGRSGSSMCSFVTTAHTTADWPVSAISRSATRRRRLISFEEDKGGAGFMTDADYCTRFVNPFP